MVCSVRRMFANVAARKFQGIEFENTLQQHDVARHFQPNPVERHVGSPRS